MPDHQLAGTLGILGRGFSLFLLHVVGMSRTAAIDTALWAHRVVAGAPATNATQLIELIGLYHV